MHPETGVCEGSIMKRKVLAGIFAVVALAVGAAGIAGVVSGSTPVGDHYVDNLGTGTTASNFDGNSSSDCTSEAFISADYDLWHFVVNQASDPVATLSWNAGLSVWSSPSSVNVVDVTTQYGNYISGDGTKHLWIATTPPGATLVTAYLDYAGTAGRENLSHACGRSTPTPGIRIDPEVVYDMTWDWAIDKSLTWEPVVTGGYALSYSVEAHRSEIPRLLMRSLHVTDGVIVIPPTLELTDLDVTFTQGSYTQQCAVNLELLHYDCELDITKISIDSATGRPAGTGTLSAVGTYSGGTLTDTESVDFDVVDPRTIHAETASITDDYATPSDSTDDLSTDEKLLEYLVNWTPSGSSCAQRTNIATLLIDNPAPGMDNPSDSVTVRWCPPLPGLTIGYWGNRTGAPLVVERLASLKSSYPGALASVPNLTSATAVRNFFQNASCAGDCTSMFAAQFLATAMNALQPDFASQGVMFGGECHTVSQLLTEANAGAVGATRIWYERYKSIFDDINNSRQVTCLTVID